MKAHEGAVCKCSCRFGTIIALVLVIRDFCSIIFGNVKINLKSAPNAMNQHRSCIVGIEKTIYEDPIEMPIFTRLRSGSQTTQMHITQSEIPQITDVVQSNILVNGDWFQICMERIVYQCHKLCSIPNTVGDIDNITHIYHKESNICQPAHEYLHSFLYSKLESSLYRELSLGRLLEPNSVDCADDEIRVDGAILGAYVLTSDVETSYRKDSTHSLHEPEPKTNHVSAYSSVRQDDFPSCNHSIVDAIPIDAYTEETNSAPRFNSLGVESRTGEVESKIRDQTFEMCSKKEQTVPQTEYNGIANVDDLKLRICNLVEDTISEQAIDEGTETDIIDLKLKMDFNENGTIAKSHIEKLIEGENVPLKPEACTCKQDNLSESIIEEGNGLEMIDLKLKTCNTEEETEANPPARDESENEIVDLKLGLKLIEQKEQTTVLKPVECEESWSTDKNDDYISILRKLVWLPLDQLRVPQVNLIVGVIFEPLDSVLKDLAVGNPPGPQITMQYELLRMCTLRNYPRDDKPYIIRLAQAGFYYAAEGDEVICYVCGLRKRGWSQSDVPIDVHRRISPNCRFLTQNAVVNVPVPRSSSSERRTFAFLEDLNVEQAPHGAGAANHSPRALERLASNTTASRGTATNTSAPLSHIPETTSRASLETPKFPQYTLRSARLSSFVNWPDNTGQVPQTLVDAGFYYADIGDCVRCFHCGIGLRHWTDEDDVWIEHARWSRNCKYLQQVKGDEFIRLVHLAVEYTQDVEEQPTTTNGGTGNTPPTDEIDRILLSNAAQSVLEMGYQPRIIKKAIERVLRQNGATGITAPMIMEQVLELEDEEVTTNGLAQLQISATTGNEVNRNPVENTIATNDHAVTRLDISGRTSSATNRNPTSSSNTRIEMSESNGPNTVSTNISVTSNGGPNISMTFSNSGHGRVSPNTNNSNTTAGISSTHATTTTVSSVRTTLNATTTLRSSTEHERNRNSRPILRTEQTQVSATSSHGSMVSSSTTSTGATGDLVNSFKPQVNTGAEAASGESTRKKSQNVEQGRKSNERHPENRQSAERSTENDRTNKQSPHAHSLPSTNGLKALREENEKLKVQTMCKVCMDKMVSVVFLPCGHLVTCTDCAPAMRKCPVCRALVKGTVKTFMG